MTPLTAPKSICGPMNGLKRQERVAARHGFVAKAAAQGYSVQQVAKALDISTSTVRDNWRALFVRPAEVNPQRDRSDRATITVNGMSVSLAPLPFEITPDPRHETAPRHRGLVATPRVPGEELLAALDAVRA